MVASRPRLLDRTGHPECRLFGILVFPHPNHRPSRRCQSLISVTVTLDCATQLVAPPLSVASRDASVLWAAVPEAAIDEDGYPWPDKRDVDLAPAAFDRAVYSKPKACLMQCRPQSQLGRSVARTLRAHSSTGLRVGLDHHT